jgi:hypothetical protein
LLDEPYPENLPVVAACEQCNKSFSLDEQYFACLVECARTGSIQAVTRPKIQRILRENPGLAARLHRSRTVAENGGAVFATEDTRVRNIALKLARCHAAYELGESHRDAPSHFFCAPLSTLDQQARNHFETPPNVSIAPEIGSRSMQRIAIAEGFILGPEWIGVQEGQYRYLAVAEEASMIRFVVGEYLACEVIWGMPITQKGFERDNAFPTS